MAAAQAAPKLDAVTFEKVGTSLKVAIRGTELGEPKQLRVNSGRSFILEFAASLGSAVKLLRVDTAGVTTVQTGWFSARPPRVRVHFRMDSAITPTVTPVEGGVDVLIGTAAAGKVPSPKDAFLEAAGVTAGSGDGRTPVLNPVEPKNSNGGDGRLPSIIDPLDKPQVDQPMDGVIADAFTDPTEKKPAPKPADKPKPKDTSKPVVKASNPGTDAGVFAVRSASNVSIDFVNTDVSLVLKALALQSGANIVTAPDIKGNLTVKLSNVTTEQALDIVTAMADLRYALVGRTYVVAQKDKFNDLLKAVSKTANTPSETRLVPIYSGEPGQIRSAVMRAFPAETAGGGYDILLAGDDDGDKATPAAGPDGKPDPKGTSVPKTFSTLYVILVGPTAVLDRTEPLIHSIDKQICAVKGVPISENADMVQETYLITSESMPAKNLLDTVRNLKASAFQNIEMYPSPLGSERQAIIMVGRKEEVLRAKKLLEEFDGASDDSIIYDIRFSEPRSLRDQLMSAIPGIRVDIPPGAVSQPRIYEAPPKKSTKSSSESGNENVSESTEGPKVQEVGVKTEKADVEGITLPFSDTERVAKPMRLFLRGNKSQLDRAKALLDKLDIEPKQVAIDLRVMEMSKEEALKVGLDWSILTGGVVNLVRLNQNPGLSAGSPGAISAGTSGVDKYSVLGTLDALNGNRSLIARPNFLATDGRETEYFVGDVIRYIESIQSSQNGVTVTTNSVRVGVRCSILPRIGADNRIFMDLRPVVSYLRGFTPVPGGGQLPQTSERIAQSNVMMDDGETIALGGLIRDEDRREVSGIPILKDIPIIGKLFSRTDTSRQRTEIVFFITAKVVGKGARDDAAMPRANVERNGPAPTERFPDPHKKK